VNGGLLVTISVVENRFPTLRIDDPHDLNAIGQVPIDCVCDFSIQVIWRTNFNHQIGHQQYRLGAPISEIRSGFRRSLR